MRAEAQRLQQSAQIQRLDDLLPDFQVMLQDRRYLENLTPFHQPFPMGWTTRTLSVLGIVYSVGIVQFAAWPSRKMRHRSK
jgi:hypothetical protein